MKRGLGLVVAGVIIAIYTYICSCMCVYDCISYGLSEPSMHV